MIYLKVICKVYHLKLNDNGKLSSALETEINRVLNKSSPASNQWMKELKRIKSELEVLLKEEKDKEAEENSDSDWVKANVQKKIQFFILILLRSFYVFIFYFGFLIFFLIWFSPFSFSFNCVVGYDSRLSFHQAASSHFPHALTEYSAPKDLFFTLVIQILTYYFTSLHKIEVRNAVVQNRWLLLCSCWILLTEASYEVPQTQVAQKVPILYACQYAHTIFLNLFFCYQSVNK